MTDDFSIPDFLKIDEATRKAARERMTCSNGHTYIDPVMQRQNELRAAQTANAKVKRTAALQKHLQKIADLHAGEEYDATLGCWKRTDRAMAKLAAQHEAEFAQQEVA